MKKYLIILVTVISVIMVPIFLGGCVDHSQLGNDLLLLAHKDTITVQHNAIKR